MTFKLWIKDTENGNTHGKSVLESVGKIGVTLARVVVASNALHETKPVGTKKNERND